jgi:hypothetical protein
MENSIESLWKNACQDNNTEIIKQLNTDFYNYRFISIAAEVGNLNVVVWLIEQHKEDGFEAIDLAAKNGFLEIVVWLYEIYNVEPMYALIYAKENKHTKVINYLESILEKCPLMQQFIDG